MENNRRQAALVSVDVPLLSNQDVWMNIALIKQYHENMPRPQAENMALNALQRLDLAYIANKRNPSLTNEERFCVFLLRACMVKDAIVMIDRPFKIIPHLKDISFIFQTLKKIDDFYVTCHIYDYKWMADKYGEL
jgi:ABC-type nitrate/sulfonate/bicarbonate transport system ATPase subunit